MQKARAKLIVLIITIVIVSIIPVNSMAENESEKYWLVRVFLTDAYNKTIRAEILLELPSPDVRLIDSEKLYNIESTGIFEVVGVSSDCLIYIDSVQRTLSDIKPETFMLITVENNLITRMMNVNSVLLQEGGIYNGILEENNSDLGYITLYFPMVRVHHQV